MKTLELTIVIVYAVAMLAIGFYFRSRASKTASSFWSAESNVGVLVNAFALLATVMSGGGMMGNIGLGATLGLAYIACANLGSGAGLGMGALLVARPLRKSGAKTISEFIKMRFPNKAIALLVPIVIAIAYTVYLVAQMKASGTVGQYLLGVDFNLALIITWAIFTVYVMIGGMLAVTWTDFLQGMLMMLVTVVTSVAALMHFGGFDAMINMATEYYPQMGQLHLPLLSYAGFFFVWVFIGLCSPHILMRVSTAKNPFGAAVSLHGGMILITIFTVCTIFILSTASRCVIGVDVPDNKDAAFLYLIEVIFNPFWKGLTAAAIFAAIMSTAAGLLIAAAAAISNDIIVGIFKPDMEEKKQARLGSLMVFVVSFIVLLFSFNPPEYITVLYTQAMNFLVCSLMIPLLTGLWWRRATDSGALAALIAGGGSYAILFFGMELPTFSEMFISLPIALVAMIVGSLLSKPSESEIIARVESWHSESEAA
ncbi:MAG: sodium:solute symporter family protein [Syntrophomonadaceae bacterium]|nr:sodium:solute symporter family protein [Syntrophomonadaceae bacterium]